MNVRSLCFARVARDRSEPWLWVRAARRARLDPAGHGRLPCAGGNRARFAADTCARAQASRWPRAQPRLPLIPSPSPKWDFIDKLGDDCSMKDKKFTPECAQQVGTSFVV